MSSNSAMFQRQDFIPQGKIIGLGMRGPIYLFRSTKTKKEYAMKVIHKFYNTKRQALGEPPGLFRLQELYLYLFLRQRPHILQVAEAFLDDSKMYFYRVFTLISYL